MYRLCRFCGKEKDDEAGIGQTSQHNGPKSLSHNIKSGPYHHWCVTSHGEPRITRTLDTERSPFSNEVYALLEAVPSRNRTLSIACCDIILWNILWYLSLLLPHKDLQTPAFSKNLAPALTCSWVLICVFLIGGCVLTTKKQLGKKNSLKTTKLGLSFLIFSKNMQISASKISSGS